MKKIATLNLFFFLSFALYAQNSEILFFDDFEQDNISSSDTTFSQWTSESITGDGYWHLIPSGATNKTQCMRFEKTDELNEDWIVTKEIVGNNIEYVKVSFRYRYTGEGIKPKLMFTNQYSGNANQSVWKEIDYVLSENENMWQSAEGQTNNPGDTLYFAFQYQSSADSSILFLFDSFQIESYNTFSDNTQGTLPLPFSDKFENEYQNWTIISDKGNDQWHISDDAADGSFCARLYANDSPDTEDDWLISKPINTSNGENLIIDFSYYHFGENFIPEFYFKTGTLEGINDSVWIKITEFATLNEWQWNDVKLALDNIDECFVFAFRYQTNIGESNKVMIDNFSIKSYVPIKYNFSDSTKYFTFYTTLENSEDYWNEISEDVDRWYKELCSYWDRPGITPIFKSDKKTAIYLLDSEIFAEQSGTELPEWKYGNYRTPNEIYVAVPPKSDPIYEGSFKLVVKNTLGQLILQEKFQREGNNDLPDYFAEAFGLYYTGHRPNRTLIMQALSDLGREPILSDIQNTDGIENSYKKDLLVSYIEAQVLATRGFQNVVFGGAQTMWQRHFKYFYENEESTRITLRKQTDNFDIYASLKDEPHLIAIANKLEEKLERYSTVFEFPMHHRFNTVIYPDATAGVYCLVFLNNYNGGSGWSGDNMDFLSPVGFQGGIEEALRSLIPHEFFHVFHFNMVPDLFAISGFHPEGMAEIMAYEGKNDEYLSNRGWYFRDGLERFKREKGRWPKLADIMPDTDGYMSVYSYGQAFWHFMKTEHTDYKTIKDFFVSGLDWEVFDISYEEIDAGYIQYLKSLAGITSVEELENNNFKLWFSNNDLFIQNTNQVGNIDIEIFTITGQKVFQNDLAVMPNEKSTISIPRLSANKFYIVKLTSEQEVFVQKLYNQ